MFEVGRLCMKIAGRDAGKKCLVVDVIDEHFVMIDGETRRRKCNITHLEPLNQIVQLTKNAPAPEVVRVLKEIGILVEEKKPKAKAATTAAKTKASRPTRQRKKKEKPVKDVKEAKAAKPAKPAKEPKKSTAKPVEKKAADAEKKE